MAFQQKQKQALRGVLQVAVAAIAIVGLCCSAPDDADRSANLPVEGYELFWADEFDGAALDSNKWQNYNPGKRRDAVNVDHAVTLDGQGHLVIATSRSGDDYHTDQAVSMRDQFIILSLEVGEWAGDIARAVLPDSLLVDYVRVYKKR